MSNWTANELRLYQMKQAVKAKDWVDKAFGKAEQIAEKKLQEQIVQWLRLQGRKIIVRSRMDRATTQAKGVADLLFCCKGQAVAWEVKVGQNVLSAEQAAWLRDAREDGWCCAVIRSLDEAMSTYAIISLSTGK